MLFNSEIGPGDHWLFNFRRRHPKLMLLKIDMLELICAEALNPEVVSEYFQLLGKTLDDNNLKIKSCQIYNCNETFLPLDHSKEKAVTKKNVKSFYCQSYGTIGGQYRCEGPEDALYARGQSGWIDSELFLSWLKKILFKYVCSIGPSSSSINRWT